jgi:PilZ domain-containing protein
MEVTVQRKQRSNPRLRRRWIDLKAGDAGVSSNAFTKDVSAGSFCAELMRVPSPGTQVRGSIVIGGNAYAFSGKVAWARASEPRMNLRGSIGVTFNEIADALKEKLTLVSFPRGGCYSRERAEAIALDRVDHVRDRSNQRGSP